MAYQRRYKLLLLFVASIAFWACENSGNHKIRLASDADGSNPQNRTASSFVRLNPEKQHAIAILTFQNHTHDQTLAWLSSGLADMLTTELTQSPYLNIIPLKHLENPADNAKNPVDSSKAIRKKLEAAREAGAEVVLVGRYYKKNDLLHIDVEMIDINTQQLVRRETVYGEGLERIFSMVDQLSDQVRSNMQGDLEDIQHTALNLKEMTQSVDAFRCYSEAIENIEKLLFTDAEKCLDEALRHDSTFASGYLRLAQVKMRLGKKNEMLKALKKTQNLSEKLSATDQIHLKMLENQLNGQYQDVLQLMQIAVNRYPANLEFRTYLAALYNNMGDFDRALQEYEAILAQDPHKKTVYNLLGYTYARRGDFTTALKYLDKYKKLAPNEPNPYDSKGEILMMAGRLDEAAKALKIAVQKWPQFYYPAKRLADIAIEKADFKTALKYSDLAIEYSPSEYLRDLNYVQRAMIYWRFGRLNEAENLLIKIIKKENFMVHPVAILSELYTSKGEPEKAIRVQHQALNKLTENIRNDKNRVNQYEELIYLSYITRLPAAAFIPLLKNAVKTLENPDSRMNAKFALGLSELRAGNAQKAGEIFEQHSHELIDLLTLKYNRGWGTGWKYLFEAMDSGNNKKLANNSFSEELLKTAKATGRKDLEFIARFSKARFYGNIGQTENMQREYRSLGTPLENEWRIIGPFSTRHVSGFDHAFPPETHQDVHKIYTDNQQSLEWHPANDGYSDGYIDLRSQLKNPFWVVSYAWIYVYSPDRRKVQMRLGADEACKLWLNDELISQRYLQKDAQLDRDLVTVVLRPGDNKVLLKITNTNLDYGFYFRVTDEKGEGFSDITFHSPESVKTNYSQRY